MRILVTGAAGFIGSRLVKRLSEEHSVTAFCLYEEEVPGAKEVVVGDVVKDLSGLSRKRFDFIYHLAAVLDETDSELWRVNVEGTRNLLDFCKNRKIKRFVFLSSVGVLGESEQPLKEDFPYNPKTRYEESKAEAERIVMDYKLKHQVPYTILRSTIVYGPNKFWEQILEAAEKGYPLLGSGDNLFHLVYIDDVIEALVKVMDVKTKNQIYHLAGPEARTYQQTYKVIADCLGVEMPSSSVPVSLAKARALAHEVKSKIQGKKPDVTMLRASIDRLVRNRVVSTEKIQKELGFTPQYSLEEGMKETVQSLGF